MSQKTKYICDGCQKETGNKAHLSLQLYTSDHCGVALPPDPFGDWRVKRFSGPTFLHFHAECIGKWADKQIKEASNYAKQ